MNQVPGEKSQGEDDVEDYKAHGAVYEADAIEPAGEEEKKAGEEEKPHQVVDVGEEDAVRWVIRAEGGQVAVGTCERKLEVYFNSIFAMKRLHAIVCNVVIVILFSGN